MAMASDVTLEPRLVAWRPTADELIAILDEMRPIVRRFAARDESRQRSDAARAPEDR
jgi:hypothetical protein